MFQFRIIDLPDGNQIIDVRAKTSIESLSPLQLLEYTEMESKISLAEYFRKKEQKVAQKNRKPVKKLLEKVACICGII